jgi:uncharacterized protein YecE (DUF72 family)
MSFFVACSGFPVPVSRYWKEFPAVEISDTEIAIPGAGTVRRWIRESPQGFAFTVLAPSSLAASGFRRTNENKELCDEVIKLARNLKAKAVVFAGDESFKHGKASRAALKSFITSLPENMPTPVFDLTAWKPGDIASVCAKTIAVAAYDPLKSAEPPPTSFTYIRLPGPAGYRSRYDEESIDELTKHIKRLKLKEGFCVFANIDKQTNAAQLIKKLK